MTMSKLLYRHIEEDGIVEKYVVFLSTYYRPGGGIRALVIDDNNHIRDVNVYDLRLGPHEYNKMFAE